MTLVYGKMKRCKPVFATVLAQPVLASSNQMLLKISSLTPACRQDFKLYNEEPDPIRSVTAAYVQLVRTWTMKLDIHVCTLQVLNDFCMRIQK